MRIGCKEYAKRLLKKCDCNEDCYRGVDVKVIEDDLKKYFEDNQDYNDYPIHDIAIALREIGDAVPNPIIKHKPYKVIWNGDSFIDGMECDTFEEAKNDALETLIQWECEQFLEMGVDSLENWTKKQIEDWDYMIYNLECWVEKYKEGATDDMPEEEQWEEYYWEPSEEDYKEIGWLIYEELKELYKEKQ